jgi:hypothetical protein
MERQLAYLISGLVMPFVMEYLHLEGLEGVAAYLTIAITYLYKRSEKVSTLETSGNSLTLQLRHANSVGEVDC